MVLISGLTSQDTERTDSVHNTSTTTESSSNSVDDFDHCNDGQFRLLVHVKSNVLNVFLSYSDCSCVFWFVVVCIDSGLTHPRYIL